MKKTIFNTPLLNRVLSGLSIGMMKFIGWRIEGQFPNTPKFVLIAAPHTSNWDFALLLLVIFSVRADIHWMGKDALFPKPFTGFVKWMGGIAIDRSKTNNTVDQMIEHYQNNDNLIVLTTPEGTRSKVNRWKTGFYHIANGANVPIVMGSVDGANKVVVLGKVFIPTGNLELDMKEIKAFYTGKQGLNPELG